MTKHSIETYQSNVSEFLIYNPDPRIVTIDQLRYYLEQLRNRHLSQSTLKGYMSAVSSFYDFLVFEKDILVNPILPFRKRYLDRTKCHPETRQLISIKEMQDIYKAARNIQERALIMVMAKTGIRRGELHDLRIRQIGCGYPQKAEGSTGMLREGSWQRSEGNYLHQDKGPLSRKLTPHCFRHWFTTHLFRSGMDPQYIKFLRGDSLREESWQIYNRIDIGLVRAEYLRCMKNSSNYHFPRIRTLQNRCKNWLNRLA